MLLHHLGVRRLRHATLARLLRERYGVTVVDEQLADLRQSRRSSRARGGTSGMAFIQAMTEYGGIRTPSSVVWNTRQPVRGAGSVRPWDRKPTS